MCKGRGGVEERVERKDRVTSNWSFHCAGTMKYGTKILEILRIE